MLNTKLASIASTVMLLAPASVNAGCWNASDSGVQGPAAEICIGGICEKTTLEFECANISGLIAGYTNGLRVEIDTTLTPNKVSVSRNSSIISEQDVAEATCAAPDREACKLGKYIEVGSDQADPSGHGEINAEIAKIRERFEALLGVDAEGFQEILIETEFLSGIPDGVWGPSTEVAVLEFVVAANKVGITIDATTDEALFRSMYEAREVLYNPNSGLSRYPFDGAHLLVVASRGSYEEAEPMALDLEAKLASIGFAGRTGTYPAISGVIAIAAGMYLKSACEITADEFKSMGAIPEDSYCLPVERIDPMSWTN